MNITIPNRLRYALYAQNTALIAKEDCKDAVHKAR